MIRKARVVAVRPKERRCDIVMLDNGQPFFGVEVMSEAASSAGGTWRTPAVPKPASETSASGLDGAGLQVIAVVAMAAQGLRPVILGFVHADGGQLLFTEDNREIHRHPATGAYWTFAPDGSMELWHPSGAFMRIGTGGHQDLAPLAADGNWTVPAGAAAATITLTNGPGTLQIDHAGNLTATYTTATLTGPTKIVGDLQVTGGVTAGFGTGEAVTLQHHVHPNTGGGTGDSPAPKPGS